MKKDVRNRIYVFLSWMVLILVPTIPARADPFTIDQQQIINGASRGFFGFGGRQGQEFVPTFSSITDATFVVGTRSNGVTSLDLTLTVRNATLNGDLSGAALGSKTVTMPIPFDGTVHFDLSFISLTTGPCTAVNLTGCYVLEIDDMTSNTAFAVGTDNLVTHTLGNRAIYSGGAQGDSFVFSEGTHVTATGAPEPSTWALLGLGLGFLLIRRKSP